MWELFPNRTFLDMNPYLVRHVGIIDSPSDIWHEAHVHHPVSLVQHEVLHWMEPNLFLLKSHLCLPSLKRKALPSSSYTSPPEDPLTLPSPSSLPPLDPVFCLLDPIFCRPTSLESKSI